MRPVELISFDEALSYQDFQSQYVQTLRDPVTLHAIGLDKEIRNPSTNQELLSYSKRLPKDAVFFAVLCPKTHRVVGTLKFMNFDHFASRVEIGYLVLLPYRNKGYGKAIVNAAVALAFGKYGLDCVYAMTYSDNVDSCELLKSLEFERTYATELNHREWNGHVKVRSKSEFGGRFGVVGLGSMGTRRGQHLEYHGCDIVGYDSRSDRNQSFASRVESDVKETYRDFVDELKSCSGLFISTPPAEHLRYIRLCNELALPYMVEQPIVHSHAHLAQVDRDWYTRHISCNLRFTNLVRRLKWKLQAGKIDKPLWCYAECSEYLPSWHPWEPYQEYYPSQANMGGGLDAICEVDWLRYLFGEVVRLQHNPMKLSSLEIDTPDVDEYLLGFDSGVVVNLHTDLITLPPRHLGRFVTEKKTFEFQFNEDSFYDTLDTPFRRRWEAEFGQFGHTKGWAWVEESYFLDTVHFLEGVLYNDRRCQESMASGLANLRVVLG